MDIKLINQRLEELSLLSPIEIEDEILKLVEDSGKSKTLLNKQLSQLQKERKIEEEKKLPQQKLAATISNILDKKDLAERILELQPCHYDKSRNWWLWNWHETKWERVDETDILNAVDSQCMINTINSKERNEILEALKQVSRLKKPQEIKPTWIQFKNELYNIEDGTKIRAEPSLFVTNPIPYQLNEEGFYNTPVMDRIFAEWVGENYVQSLYEILAYCLIPDYPIHRIFCFIGGGMNGKSCFLNLLRKFIGKANCCSTELDTLLASRFEVTRLHKKLVCQMGETNFNEMNKTSVLKKLSGGDLIGFEYKNKDPFEEINYAKIIIATNNLPATTDKTIGFYRRWMIIDFPNQFSEKKDILAEIPEEEYNALAVKCAFILKELLETRTFTNEGSIEDRMQRYEEKSNFIEMFFNKFTMKKSDGYITKSSFYRKFIDFCKENRYREMSEKSVSQKLGSMGIEAEKRYFNWLHDGKGGQVRCWEGVAWLDD